MPTRFCCDKGAPGAGEGGGVGGSKAALGLLVVALVSGLSEPAAAQYYEEPAESSAGLFSQGRMSVGVVLGQARSASTSYLVVGGSFGYYVVDGLELGLGSDVWLLDSPTVLTVTPQAKYVLHFVPVFKPYAGGFFRRYIIGDNFADYSSVGARGGAALVTGGGATALGLGAVYEHYLSCDVSLRSCDDWYPEVSFSATF